MQNKKLPIFTSQEPNSLSSVKMTDSVLPIAIDMLTYFQCYPVMVLSSKRYSVLDDMLTVAVELTDYIRVMCEPNPMD